MIIMSRNVRGGLVVNGSNTSVLNIRLQNDFLPLFIRCTSRRLQSVLTYVFAKNYYKSNNILPLYYFCKLQQFEFPCN